MSAQSVSTSIHPRRPPLVSVVVLLLVLCGARCCIGCASRLARSNSKTQKVNAQVLRPSIVGLLELARTTFTTNPQLSSNALTVRQSKLHLVLIDNHVPVPGALGAFGVLGRSRTLFSRFDWPARAGLKKNARLRARFSRFFARTWPPGLDFGRSRTSPGSFWEAETPRFSSFFVAPARSVLTSCEVYKTLAGATFFTHRSFRATTQKQ